MHPSVMEYAATLLTPRYLAGRRVLEVGSLNVNGSVRTLCSRHAASWTGIDIQQGDGVDVVMDAADAPTLGTFDLVVTTEMMEHAADWRSALYGITGATREGGGLLLTTRGPGAGWHPHPEDHWRFPVPLMGQALRRLGYTLDDLRSDPGVGYTDGVFAFAHRTNPNMGDLEDLHAEPAPLPLYAGLRPR